MQIRSRIESENVQREKKIDQLNDFIARFSAGTRASQVASRRKEVERLQTTDLARSNIQRPYIKFAMNRPSGRMAVEFSNVCKAFGDLQVIDGFSAVVTRGEKIVLVGRNGVGKTTMIKTLLAEAPGQPSSPGDIDRGNVRWGPGVHRILLEDPPEAIRTGRTLSMVQHLSRSPRASTAWPPDRCSSAAKEGLKPTDALSGGEAARLLFCRSCCRSEHPLRRTPNHLDLIDHCAEVGSRVRSTVIW